MRASTLLLLRQSTLDLTRWVLLASGLPTYLPAPGCVLTGTFRDAFQWLDLSFVVRAAIHTRSISATVWLLASLMITSRRMVWNFLAPGIWCGTSPASCYFSLLMRMLFCVVRERRPGVCATWILVPGGVAELSMGLPWRHELCRANADPCGGAISDVAVLAWPYGPPNHHDQRVCVSPPTC